MVTKISLSRLDLQDECKETKTRTTAVQDLPNSSCMVTMAINGQRLKIDELVTIEVKEKVSSRTWFFPRSKKLPFCGVFSGLFKFGKL